MGNDKDKEMEREFLEGIRQLSPESCLELFFKLIELAESPEPQTVMEVRS